MIRTANLNVAYEDQLVKVWRKPDGDCIAQGKRVAASHPWTQEERQAWVNFQSAATLVRLFMQTRGMSVTDAYTLFKQGRGKIYTKLNWKTSKP